jgi:hypothetical protein
MVTFAAIAIVPLASAEQHSQPQRCTASASIAYLQRGAEADVEVTIENNDCAASTGTYAIEATIKADNADAPEKLTFPETWSRGDDQPVFVARRYPIGDDVDLLRLKIRKLRCTCAEAAEPAGDP